MRQISTQQHPAAFQKPSKDTASILAEACQKIAPLWSLESFVAVNPYLGLSGQPFARAASQLSKAGDIKMTMPSEFYVKAFNQGEILSEDIEKALYKYRGQAHIPAQAFMREIEKGRRIEPAGRVSLVLDNATKLTGKEFGEFMIDRITSWASSFFDQGQALWKGTTTEADVFSNWKTYASTDRTPSVMGIKSFRKMVAKLPNNPLEAASQSLEILNIPESALSLYLHSLLLKVGGWSAYIAQLDWNAKLYGNTSEKLSEFLSILLCWEACLLQSFYMPEMDEAWNEAKRGLLNLHRSRGVHQKLQEQLILQQAYDNACQRRLIEQFTNSSTQLSNHKPRPKAQAIFCIDVRSEVFRRNLEMVADEVETLGFAGFFGFPIKHISIGHQEAQAQCPVLIPAGPTVIETTTDSIHLEKAVSRRTAGHQLSKAWKSFKLGAISCFSFVGPVGLAYLPKLFTDTFGLSRPIAHPNEEGLSKEEFNNRRVSLSVQEYNKQTVGIPLEEQVSMAKNALTAMSLTENFGRLVLIVGHGSSTVNNPHATGLDCGACGGSTGEANAKVAATALNNPEVRVQLANEGLMIPEDTYFLACLHDTTTDEVSVFHADQAPYTHEEEIQDMKQWLAQAGHASRTERAIKLGVSGGKNIDTAVISRSKDWSQVRPEWGLAGCNAFVVAPRERSMGINLDGKSFLHSYNWKQDQGFAVLESIMSAPMVVTSWINLQYYASTVDNEHFGSGNKTLHNITSGIGVLEGYSGDLRVGLPMQSVHDGEKPQHLPQRLNVIIEAPIDAMNQIIQKHSGIRDLCDNGWISLLAMNEEGKVSHSYKGNMEWERVHTEALID